MLADIQLTALVWLWTADLSLIWIYIALDLVQSLIYKEQLL